MNNKSLHTYVIPAYKESVYLEECIKSVLNQKYKSDVLIATSTPNDYIYKLAKKYKINVIENPDSGKGIGYDFDFAINIANTEIVTIAHQDDIYDYEYSYNVVQKYLKNKDSQIIFTDYYEIKNNIKVYSNSNLKIKRLLLTPIKFSGLSNKKIIKRLILKFGCSISCPAVSFVKKNVELPIFASNLKCDVDWYAWEKLSRKNGRFSFVNKKLMGHRIHDESTTTEIIKDNIRTKEDFEILRKFWPKSIAKIISKMYSNSERSNNLLKK